jgi:hypothetical protein
MDFADELYREETNQMKAVGLTDFLKLQVPAREMLLEPIIPTASLSMVYGARGGGKSFLSTSIGLAIASGCPLLQWKAPTQKRVLLVDGELPISLLQERIKLISSSLGVSNAARFQVLAADTMEQGIKIDTEVGQKGRIKKVSDGASLSPNQRLY